MSIGTFFPYGTGYTAGLPPQTTPTATTAITADSNQTWTVAQVLNGIILRTLTATARTDTTPTAAALVAVLPQDLRRVGASWYLDVIRTDAAAVALTIAAGTGVTLVGTMTVAASNARALFWVVTNATAGSEAISIYSLGASTA
jgi:hypothetical protein